MAIVSLRDFLVAQLSSDLIDSDQSIVTKF
jgi:hypothetical protein